MHNFEHEPLSPPPWRDLLGSGYRKAATVLSAGVLLGATNIYLAASLLPTAVADLGAESLYAWNITAYLVAMVLMTMLTGRVLARWGPTGAYLLGFTMFFVGSLACAASPTMVGLVLGRAAQGLGAGLLSGLGFAVIRTVLPRRLWTRGNALISAMYGVGNFVGPALGGVFSQFGSWRLAFVVMAAAAIAIAVIVPRAMPRGTGGAHAAPVPVLSLSLVAAGTAVVSVAGVLGDTSATVAGLLVAVLLVVGFVICEARSRVGVFPRITYRRGSPLKWIYLTIGFLAVGVAVESFLPLLGQRLGGLPPLVAGFLAAALSLGWSLSQIASSSAVRRRTVYRLWLLGPVLLVCGLLLYGVMQTETPTGGLILAWVPVLFLAGAGIGVAYPHLSVAAMSSTPDADEGRRAAAGVATVTTMATAFGTSVAGVLINLGGGVMVDAARYLIFGFAGICAIGVVTATLARRSLRTSTVVAKKSAADQRRSA